MDRKCLRLILVLAFIGFDLGRAIAAGSSDARPAVERFTEKYGERPQAFDASVDAYKNPVLFDQESADWQRQLLTQALDLSNMTGEELTLAQDSAPLDFAEFRLHQMRDLIDRTLDRYESRISGKHYSDLLKTEAVLTQHLEMIRAARVSLNSSGPETARKLLAEFAAAKDAELGTRTSSMKTTSAPRVGDLLPFGDGIAHAHSSSSERASRPASAKLRRAKRSSSSDPVHERLIREGWIDLHPASRANRTESGALSDWNSRPRRWTRNLLTAAAVPAVAYFMTPGGSALMTFVPTSWQPLGAIVALFGIAVYTQRILRYSRYLHSASEEPALDPRVHRMLYWVGSLGNVAALGIAGGTAIGIAASQGWLPSLSWLISTAHAGTILPVHYTVHPTALQNFMGTAMVVLSGLAAGLFVMGLVLAALRILIPATQSAVDRLRAWLKRRFPPVHDRPTTDY